MSDPPNAVSGSASCLSAASAYECLASDAPDMGTTRPFASAALKSIEREGERRSDNDCGQYERQRYDAPIATKGMLHC